MSERCILKLYTTMQNTLCATSFSACWEQTVIHKPMEKVGNYAENKKNSIKRIAPFIKKKKSLDKGSRRPKMMQKMSGKLRVVSF